MIFIALGLAPKRDEPFDDVAHGEAATFKQCAGKMLPAMLCGESIEAAARFGDPFRRHCTRECRQEDHAFRAGWSLRGKRFKVIEARHIEKVHEPFDGTARQPAGVLKKVIAGRIGMRLDQGCRVDLGRIKQASDDFAGADRHAQRVDLDDAGAKRCRKIIPGSDGNHGCRPANPSALSRERSMCPLLHAPRRSAAVRRAKFRNPRGGHRHRRDRTNCRPCLSRQAHDR